MPFKRFSLGVGDESLAEPGGRADRASTIAFAALVPYRLRSRARIPGGARGKENST